MKKEKAGLLILNNLKQHQRLLWSVYKIDVINIVTAPEIEMLIIHSEGMYEKYKSSGKKPCEFCMQDLRKLRYRKKYDDVIRYFDTPDKLVNAIKAYHQKQQDKSEYSLLNLLKE